MNEIIQGLKTKSTIKYRNNILIIKKYLIPN